MLLFIFLVASSLGGAFAVRDFRRMNPVVPAVLSRNGVVLLPKRMPVPPSGPSKQHNSVPRLRFIPATVVYGSKRLVPSGANPLHH